MAYILIYPLSEISPLSGVHPFVRSSTINGNSSNSNARNLPPTMDSDSEYDFELDDDDRASYDYTGEQYYSRFQERQNKQDLRLKQVYNERLELEAERNQCEEADFEDFLELRDEHNRREEADFEDFLELRDEHNRREEADFEDFLELQAERNEQEERIYARWRGKQNQLNDPDMHAYRLTPAARVPSAPAAAASRAPSANRVIPYATCSICHHHALILPGEHATCAVPPPPCSAHPIRCCS